MCVLRYCVEKSLYFVDLMHCSKCNKNQTTSSTALHVAVLRTRQYETVPNTKKFKLSAPQYMDTVNTVQNPKSNFDAATVSPPHDFPSSRGNNNPDFPTFLINDSVPRVRNITIAESKWRMLSFRRIFAA